MFASQAMSTPLVLLFFLSLTAVRARDQVILNPTAAAPTATVLPSALGYTYIGCWNETVGVAGAGGARALTGGMNVANNSMTIMDCLKHCSQGYNDATMQYAGLENGRECWCGAYISALSEKLSDSQCTYACDGNASEVCGGSLTLSLYNLTSISKTGIAWSLIAGQPAWYGTAAIAMLIVAAIL